VTTSQVIDASPAGFAAHVRDRGQQSEIARQYIEETKADVILGGGEDRWYPEGNEGVYPDDPAGGGLPQRPRQPRQQGQEARLRLRERPRRPRRRQRSQAPRALRQRGDVPAGPRGRAGLPDIDLELVGTNVLDDRLVTLEYHPATANR
jgi:hypothetical protein